LIFGLFAALIYVSGAAETWQNAGNPGSPIREITRLAEQKFCIRAENNRGIFIRIFELENLRFT